MGVKEQVVSAHELSQFSKPKQWRKCQVHHSAAMTHIRLLGLQILGELG